MVGQEGWRSSVRAVLLGLFVLILWSATCEGLSVGGGSQHDEAARVRGGGSRGSTYVSSNRLLALQHTSGSKSPNVGGAAGKIKAGRKDDSQITGEAQEGSSLMHEDELAELKAENAKLKGLIDSLKSGDGGAPKSKKDAVTNLVQKATIESAAHKTSTPAVRQINERLAKDLQRMLHVAKGISDGKKQKKELAVAAKEDNAGTGFSSSSTLGSTAAASAVVALQKAPLSSNSNNGHGPSFFKSPHVTENARAHRERADAEKKLHDDVFGETRGRSTADGGPEGSSAAADASATTISPAAKETQVVKTISSKHHVVVKSTQSQQAAEVKATSSPQQDAGDQQQQADGDEDESTSLR